MAAATSPGVPILRIGMAMPARRCISSPAALSRSVRIGPGAMALTRMPLAA